jgi:hypothetical protein
MPASGRHSRGIVMLTVKTVFDGVERVYTCENEYDQLVLVEALETSGKFESVSAYKDEVYQFGWSLN